MLRSDPGRLAILAAAALWAAAAVALVVLVWGGRVGYHRRRRRHRDDMCARGLNTHYDDTGVLDPREWITPNSGARFVRRTGVRRSQNSGPRVSTNPNHPR